jgi:hypothetical protein
MQREETRKSGQISVYSVFSVVPKARSDSSAFSALLYVKIFARPEEFQTDWFYPKLAKAAKTILGRGMARQEGRAGQVKGRAKVWEPNPGLRIDLGVSFASARSAFSVCQTSNPLNPRLKKGSTFAPAFSPDPF